jgi:hypothetical protein
VGEKACGGERAAGLQELAAVGEEGAASSKTSKRFEWGPR